MTANLRLIPNSHLDPVTLTVTSEETDYPKEYLQNSQPAWKWRSTDASVQQIEWDNGELKAADAYAHVEANFSPESDVRLELSANADYSDPVLDITFDGKLPFYGLGEGPLGLDGLGGFSDENEVQNLRTIWFDLVSYRYGRVTITDTANADGYVEVGKIMVGQSWSPATNHNWGAAHRRVKESTISRTRGGGARSSPATSYRVVSVGFSWLDDVEDAELDDILARYGLQSGVLLSCYPEEGGARERTYSVYGLLSGWTESRRLQTQRYEIGFDCEELK